MLFNSFIFIFAFLPVCLCGFYALSRHASRAAWGWIVLCSLFFYSYWDIRFLPVIAVSIIANYAVAQGLFSTPERPRLQTSLLAVGVAGNIAALCYYKYLFAIFGFLRASAHLDVPFAQVALPLGISFFTFTQIGYLVDVKQGTARHRNLLDYALFVTFFPHLIAGPILHHAEMMPQFADRANQRFNAENFAVGVTIFLIGLVKKVVIADMLSDRVALGFGGAGHIGTLAAWMAAITFTFQLYFDFSGYSDMAIGLARMFNVRFPMNFNSPFKAASIIDYWQRWHMTLTRFVNMYLFTPVSLALTRRWLSRHPGTLKAATSRPGSFLILVAFPLLLTMGVLGIWHGAGFQYLIFGLLNGAYLVVNHAARNLLPKRGAQQRPAVVEAALHAGKVLLTCLCVLMAQIFFRSASVGQALDMLAGLVGLHAGGAPGPVQEIGLSKRFWAEIALLYGIVWAAPNTQQIMEMFNPVLGRFQRSEQRASVRFVESLGGDRLAGRLVRATTWRPGLGTAFAALIVFAFCLTRMTGISPFLYFQF
ncbi:MAG: alginate O-acetyltransferase complex protein AlgI [Sphingomonadales bacterium]|jgi:D-alanyl-lipoteichoic acid acyltransferase DltB (MBOAT superfamily)|nr:alginate O-acetyltransferase complex protein AlgI [Sphingomonadales bacterium]